MPVALSPRRRIARRPLAHQVYEELRNQIRDGKLRPGERLIEMDIAAAMGTSRGPVREAVALLHRDGVVRLDPFVGASIVSPGEAELEEIFTLRAALEGYAAGLIVERRRPDDIKSLYEITARMRSVSGGDSASRLRRLDADFHAAFVKLAGHSELARVLNQLSAKIAIYVTSAESVFGNSEILARSHELMIGALAGDPLEAERSVRAQLIRDARAGINRTRHEKDLA